MATVFAAILTLLVIVSSSLRAESFPQGCRKMVGVLEDHIPGQYVVRVSRGVKPAVVVQLMLEMATSDCARTMYRTSNTSDASEEPITCSGMIYIQYFGFAAKMSDAALMWLCDKESVEYIEPSYNVTIATKPTIAPITEDTGSGESAGTEVVPENILPSTTTGGSVTSQIYSSVKIAPVTTSQLVATTTPTTVTCSKLHGNLQPVNNYLIMFQPYLPLARQNELHILVGSIRKVDESFDSKKIKPIFRGPARGFYYNGLNREAIMMLCGSDLIDYMQVQGDASSTPMPQPTNNPNANPTPATVAPTTSVSATPTPVACDKLVKYDDNTGIISDRYILILKKHTSKTARNDLISQLKSFMNPGSHNSIHVKKVLPADNMKIITVETNQAGLEWICKNEHVQKIDHDKTMSIANPAPTTVAMGSTSVSITPSPVVCNKLVTYDDNTGIISDRYILMLKKDTSPADMKILILKLTSFMNFGSHNLIQVKKVIPIANMKMITVETNQAGLEWICHNEHVQKIDHDKSMSIANPASTSAAVASTSVYATPTPVVCDKLVKYDDNTGIIPDRYILMLKSHTSQADMNNLITQLMNFMNSGSHSSIQVKKVNPAEEMNMITVEMNQAGLEWVCQNTHVDRIDRDRKTMIPNPSQPPEPSENIQPKCNKLRGALPKSGVSHCRISMKKSIKQQDRDQIIERMEQMNKSLDNTIQFTVTRVFHHKHRSMITAQLNLDAINEICQLNEIESIRTIS